MLGLDRDIVRLDKYDPSWKDEFEKEKLNVKKCLGDIALTIEHVGSTSIEGLSAKPIIDMAVGVKDTETLRSTIKLLSDFGYDVLDSIEDKEEVLARKGTPENRTHYIHVMVVSGSRYVEQVLFRDYLRAHREEVERYEELKKSSLEKFADNRKAYTASKNEYIRSVIEKAKQEK